MQMYKEFKIGEHKYSSNYYSPEDGLAYLATLTKLLGVPICMMLSKGKKGELFSVLPQAVEALVSRMDEPAVVKLVKDLLSTTDNMGTIVGGEAFNTHFRGRIGSVFKLLYQVVQFQYDDFLSAAISAGVQEMAKEKARQSISNG
jgi:hypothetical protein